MSPTRILQKANGSEVDVAVKRELEAWASEPAWMDVLSVIASSYSRSCSKGIGAKLSGTTVSV